MLTRSSEKDQSSADTTAGMLQGVFAAPSSRVVEVELSSDKLRIIQISVHGGTKPWGKYPLGANNGAATLDGVELIQH